GVVMHGPEHDQPRDLELPGKGRSGKRRNSLDVVSPDQVVIEAGKLIQVLVRSLASFHSHIPQSPANITAMVRVSTVRDGLRQIHAVVLFAREDTIH